MRFNVLHKSRDTFLKIPIFYKLFTFILSKFGTSRLIAYAKYLPYTPGKILDLGCTRTSARYFRSEDYVGIDISGEYLSDAVKV